MSSRNEDPESAERYEQIIRVDANALLRTIKELEYKLSEHQRQDKMPAWAAALETRLARVEHITLPGSPESKSRPRTSLDPEAADEQGSTAEVSNERIDQLLAESAPAKEGKVDIRSLQDLVLEDKVVTKVRGELDNKLHAAELNFDAKLSAFALEMDRVHKLLQIRPTTSEMQQVMVAVHDIEKEVKSSLEDIKEDVTASLRGRISDEMVSIMQEMRSSKALADSSMQVINNTVSDYAVEMSELRSGVQQSVSGLQEELTEAKGETKEVDERLTVARAQLLEEMAQLNGLCIELKTEQRAAADQFATYKSKNAELANQLQLQISGNSERHDKDASLLRSRIEQVSEVADSAQSKIQSIDDAFQGQVSKLQAAQAVLQNTLEDQQFKVKELGAIVEEFLAMDFASKLAKHDETFNKVKYDILDLQNMFESSLSADIKTLNVKIALLQEACNIQLPNAVTDLNVRLDKIKDQVFGNDEGVRLLNEKLEVTDHTVSELLPLKDRVGHGEDEISDIHKEIASMKETMLSTIDNSDDIARRVEEVEEVVDHMDESISERMNQVRDTLMDTLLESQSETHMAMKNVRDNLEVMSMAGEPGSGSGGGGGGGGMAGSRRSSMNAGSGFNLNSRSNAEQGDGDDLSVGSGNARTGSMGGAPLSRQGSRRGSANANFKRPSISGAVVQGVPPPSISRQTSFSDPVGGSPPQLSPAGFGRGVLRRGSSMQIPPTHSRGMAMGGHGGMAGAGGAAAASAAAPPAGMLGVLGKQHSYRMGGFGNPNFRIGNGSFNPQGGNPFAASVDNNQMVMVPAGVTAAGGSMLAPPRPGGMLDMDSVSRDGEYDDSSQTTPAVSSKAPLGGDGQQQQGGQMQLAPAPSAGPKGRAGMLHIPSGPESQQQQQGSLLENEMAEMIGAPAPAADEYIHFNQAQFLADLCLNFEEISVKRKRVATVPPMICESIADVAMELADYMAKSADFDMVEGMLSDIAGVGSLNEAQYDEHFVLNKRQEKVEQFLHCVTQSVVALSPQPQPGMVRMDARVLFVSMIKKSMDLFMTKHNQVLVVGNSRLGRIKIPSCVACDRPLLDKVRMDQAVSRGDHRSAGSMGSASAGGMLRHLTASQQSLGDGSNYPPGSSSMIEELDHLPPSTAPAGGAGRAVLAPIGGSKVGTPKDRKKAKHGHQQQQHPGQMSMSSSMTKLPGVS